MIIGIPKEIQTNENRVSLLPVGAETFVQRGHTVLVENNAGVGSGLENDEYVKAGARIIDGPAEIFKKADIRSVTIAMMEVPCCHGLSVIVERALKKAGARIPVEEAVITVRGEAQQGERQSA